MNALHPMLKGRRLLIFDFDGTLVDTSPMHAAAFRLVLQPLGIHVDYPSIAGLRTLDAIGRCLAAVGRQLPAAEVALLASAKQAAVREMISAGLQLLPGVEDFLSWAGQRFQLAIATSGSRGTVQLALTQLRIERCFNPIVCSDDVCEAKPAPEAFLRVLADTRTPPAEALIFEDSEAGFAAARAAGVDYIDVPRAGW